MIDGYGFPIKSFGKDKRGKANWWLRMYLVLGIGYWVDRKLMIENW